VRPATLITVQKARIEVGGEVDGVADPRPHRLEDEELVVDVGSEDADRSDSPIRPALGVALDDAIDDTLEIVVLAVALGVLPLLAT